MSSTVFSETLQSITTTKLTELSKKRSIFENRKNAILSAADNELDQKLKLRVLVEGVKQSFAVRTTVQNRGNAYSRSGGIIVGATKDQRLEVLLKNIERFLAQADYDPTISPKLLQDWEASLLRELNVQSLKYQYATLYGELVTQWLSAEQGQHPLAHDELEEDFEHVKLETKSKDEGRAQWERLVFKPAQVNEDQLNSYLRSLFGLNGSNSLSSKALHALRSSVTGFENGSNWHFNEHVLRWSIGGLLGSGLLSNEKNAALRDFLTSPVILTEVADVLNMRMAAIDSWKWEAELPVEQRRHVNGKHHIYIDEDLLQAIFLQFIGVKWSVFLKEAFTRFSDSRGSFVSIRQPIPIADKWRREYFLGYQNKQKSANGKRQGLFKSIFFMSQLPDSEYQTSSVADGEEEVDYEQPRKKRAMQMPRMGQMQVQQSQQMQQMQTQAVAGLFGSTQQAPAPQMPSAPGRRRDRDLSKPSYHAASDEYDFEDEDDKPESPMATKQFLLHLLSTEMLINSHLHGEFTCVHAEFESWFPSLPHSTILTVLKFFGLSSKWLRFFRAFLEAPLKFTDDGLGAEVRTRKRGVPGAHSLSTVCGEAILFCLDYAVNRRTHGCQLYRLHDDFWMWSPNHHTVVNGWDAVTTFAKVMGVSLNEGRAGSARISKDEQKSGNVHESLPEGQIRWGFLYLDPTTGRFLIDQTMVEKHVKELELQLHDKKSIFAWIQAWNAFAGRFFTSNFGKPANCFGRDHVNAMLKSLEHIQRKIFSDNNVVEYLKQTMEAQFNISNVPDGYLMFPASLGGLELHNPFVSLVQLRDGVYERPERAMEDFIEAEREAYQSAKRNFESGNFVPGHSNKPPGTDEFMSFEEYTRYREDFSCEDRAADLYSVFVGLLKKPTAERIDLNKSDSLLLGNYPALSDDYWSWIAQLYGPEMLERFGGLNIVDPGLLPIGMVNLFREGKVKWQD